MPQSKPQFTEHRVSIQAPAEAVYDLLADVTRWPLYFPPTVHAERLSGDERSERIRLWATANGVVKNWTSLRSLDREALRIGFRQEISQDPVAAMSGEWILEPKSPTETLAVLTHDFTAVRDDPAQVRWINDAVDRNSAAELDSLKRTAEFHDRAEEAVLSFGETILVEGTVETAYDFIYDCGKWPDRLPHVSGVRLTEDEPNLQSMEMDTRAPDGSLHTTHSLRVCVPHSKIVYKQTVTPPIMAAHTGLWLFLPEPGGVAVISEHSVVINAEAVPEVLGAGTTVAEAGERVRQALTANSHRTLMSTKQYVEERRHA
jgi:aromatase